MAAETSQTDTAELLLKHHADVNRSNVDFRATPVHIATVMGNWAKKEATFDLGFRFSESLTQSRNI